MVKIRAGILTASCHGYPLMSGYYRMPETDAQISGLLEAIEAKVTYLLSEQQKAEKQVLSQLAENHCDICDVSDLTAEQLNWLEEWYEKNLLPLLSPTTIDPRHPFPFIQNKGQGLLIEMANHQKKAQKVVILLPLNTPRFVAVPAENNMAQDALNVPDNFIGGRGKSCMPSARRRTNAHGYTFCAPTQSFC